MKLYFHLKNLPINSLGREVIEEQERNKHLPSLVKELEKHLADMGEDPSTTSKNIWKKRVKSYIRKKTREDLLILLKKNKKIDFAAISKEQFEKRSILMKWTYKQ